MYYVRATQPADQSSRLRTIYRQSGVPYRNDDPPCGQMIPSILDRPGTLPQQDADQGRPREQGERVDEPIDHAVRHIGVFMPDVSLGDQTPEITPDRVPRPTEDLLEEPPVRFHGGQEFGLFTHLHVGVPSVADHPTGQELVVARVEMIFPHPEIMGKAVDEFGVLEDDGPVSGGPPGQARDPTIDMRRARDFNVPDRQPERGEDFPDGHPRSTGLDALTRPDASDLLILEASEDVGQQGGRPDGIVIGKDDDVGRTVSDPVHHLQTFIGERDGQDADLVGVHRVGQFLKRALHGLLGDNDDLLGISLEPRKGGLYSGSTRRRVSLIPEKLVGDLQDPPLNSSPASIVGTIIVTSSLAI